MQTIKITIEAFVSAPKQKVWNCYTQPEHITQWNFADPSWHCPGASNDMKVGGRYVARMEARDGSLVLTLNRGPCNPNSRGNKPFERKRFCLRKADGLNQLTKALSAAPLRALCGKKLYTTENAEKHRDCKKN